MESSENTSLQLPIPEKALPKLLKSCPLFPRVLLSVQQQQQQQFAPPTTLNTGNFTLSSTEQLPHASTFQPLTTTSATMSTIPMTPSVTTNSQSSNSGNGTNPFFPLILAATSHSTGPLSATPVSLQLHVNSLQQPTAASTIMHQPISASGTAQPHFVSTSSLLSPAAASSAPVVALSPKNSRTVNASMVTTSCTSSPSLIATFANRNITIGNTSNPITCSNSATFASVVIAPQPVTNVQSPAFALRVTSLSASSTCTSTTLSSPPSRMLIHKSTVGTSGSGDHTGASLNHITTGPNHVTPLSFVVTDPHQHQHQLVATIPSSQSSCRAKYINIGTAATPVPILPTQLRLMPTTSTGVVAVTTTTATTTSTTCATPTSNIGGSVLLPTSVGQTTSYFVKPSGNLSSPTGCNVSPNKCPSTTGGAVQQQQPQMWPSLLSPAAAGGGGCTAPTGQVLTLQPASSSAGTEPVTGVPVDNAGRGQHLLVHTPSESGVVSTSLRASVNTITSSATTPAGQVSAPTLLTLSLTPANTMATGLICTTSSSLIPTGPTTHQAPPVVGGRTLAVTYANSQPAPSLVIRAATTGSSSGSLTFSVSTVGPTMAGGGAVSGTSLLKPISLMNTGVAGSTSSTGHSQSHQHIVPVNIAPATKASGQGGVAVTSAMVSPLRSSIVSAVSSSLVSVSPSPVVGRHPSATSSPIFPLVNSALSSSIAGSRKRARKQQLAATLPSNAVSSAADSATGGVKAGSDCGVEAAQVVRTPLPSTLIPLASARYQAPLASATSASSTVVTFTSGNTNIGAAGGSGSGGRPTLIPPTGCLQLMTTQSKLSPRGQQTPPLLPTTPVTEWATTSSCPVVGGHTLTTSASIVTPTCGNSGLVGIRLLSIRPPPGVATAPAISASMTLASQISISPATSSLHLSSSNITESTSLVVPITAISNAATATGGSTVAQSGYNPPTVRLCAAPQSCGNNSITTALLSPTIDPKAFMLSSAPTAVSLPESTTLATSALVAAAGGLVQLRCRPHQPTLLSSPSQPVVAAVSDGQCSLTDSSVALTETDAPKAASCAKTTGAIRPSLLVNHHTSLLHRHLRSTPPPSPSSIIKTMDQAGGSVPVPGCLVSRGSSGDEAWPQHDSSASDSRSKCEAGGRNRPCVPYNPSHHQLAATSPSERRTVVTVSGVHSTGVTDATVVSAKRNRLSTAGGAVRVTSNAEVDKSTVTRYCRKRTKPSHSLSTCTDQQQDKCLEESSTTTTSSTSSASHPKSVSAEEASLLSASGTDNVAPGDGPATAGSTSSVKSDDVVNTPDGSRCCVLTVNPSTGCELVLSGLPARPSIFNGAGRVHPDSASTANSSSKSTHFLTYSEVRYKPGRSPTTGRSAGPSYTQDRDADEDDRFPPLLRKYDNTAGEDEKVTMKSEDEDVIHRRRRSTRRAAATQRTAVLTRRQAAAREKQRQQLEEQELHKRCHQPSTGALQRRLLSDLLALTAQQADRQLVNFPITSVSPLELTGWRMISCSNNLTQLAATERLDLETLNKLADCLLQRSHQRPHSCSPTRVDGATDSPSSSRCCCRAQPPAANDSAADSVVQSTTAFSASPVTPDMTLSLPQRLSGTVGGELTTTGCRLLDLIKGICQRKQQLISSIQRIQQHTVNLVQHFRPRALQLSFDLEAMTTLGAGPSRCNASRRSSVAVNSRGDGNEHDATDADTEEDSENPANLSRCWSGRQAANAFLNSRTTRATRGMALRRSTRQHRRGRSSSTTRSRRVSRLASAAGSRDSVPKGGTAAGGKRRSAALQSANETAVYKQQIVCNGLGRTPVTRK